jgi:hypothetical protein
LALPQGVIDFPDMYIVKTLKKSSFKKPKKLQSLFKCKPWGQNWPHPREVIDFPYMCIVKTLKKIFKQTQRARH